MGTIANPFFKIKYQIITNSANTDPPSIVGPLTEAIVNAATLAAAITALAADLSINASTQRLEIVYSETIHAADTVYN
jgi:uncharacterized transporter YbjL